MANCHCQQQQQQRNGEKSLTQIVTFNGGRIKGNEKVVTGLVQLGDAHTRRNVDYTIALVIILQMFVVAVISTSVSEKRDRGGERRRRRGGGRGSKK